MRALVLSAVAFVVLSGCMHQQDWKWGPDPAWDRDPCDPNPNSSISRNAPTLSSFTGSLNKFVKRLIEGAGDRLDPDRHDAHPSYGPED